MNGSGRLEGERLHLGGRREGGVGGGGTKEGISQLPPGWRSREEQGGKKKTTDNLKVRNSKIKMYLK